MYIKLYQVLILIMKYYCDICDFETESRSTWSHHKKSKKHTKNNLEKELKEKELQEKESQDHEKIRQNYEIELLKEKLKALENQLNKTENQLVKTEKQLDHTKEQYENQLNDTKEQYESQLKHTKGQYESHIETLKMQNNFQKQLINSAGGIIQKSVNTLSFLLLNYNQAPCLKGLNDYSIISKNIDHLVKDLIFYYKKGKLDKYFGDFLVKQYKNDDPELQALWSSDTDRLNYFIRELINSNNSNDIVLDNENKKIDTQWIVDRKGLKMTKYIINPLLEYIIEINVNYLNQKYKKNEELKLNEGEIIFKDMEAIAHINSDIKNHILSKNINKYIAPYFYFDKNKVKTIKNKKAKK